MDTNRPCMLRRLGTARKLYRSTSTCNEGHNAQHEPVKNVDDGSKNVMKAGRARSARKAALLVYTAILYPQRPTSTWTKSSPCWSRSFKATKICVRCLTPNCACSMTGCDGWSSAGQVRSRQANLANPRSRHPSASRNWMITAQHLTNSFFCGQA
jgi:hypothetical protein